MRILYFGSGAFGLPTLEHLCKTHEVLAVISQPDKPAGRKRRLTPTPIAAWALEQGLTVHREDNVNTPGFVSRIADYKADASVVIAFGQKLGEPLIDAMGKLAINLHASLLPAYRGAAPINWAMIDNHTATGVSVIALAQRMDAGDVYATGTLDIDPLETAGELHDRLALLGPAAIGRVLDDLANNSLSPVVQDESKATKARKFIKQDGTVDFNQPAPNVRARIHGLTPWPGCKVIWQRVNHPAEVLTLLRVQDTPGLVSQLQAKPVPDATPGTILENSRIACASGTVRPLQLQLPGKRAMTFEEFAVGHPLLPGETLRPLDAE